jgi:hypothetical protein
MTTLSRRSSPLGGTLADAALDSPNDIVPWQTSPVVPDRAHRAEARSVLMLFSDRT